MHTINAETMKAMSTDDLKTLIATARDVLGEKILAEKKAETEAKAEADRVKREADRAKREEERTAKKIARLEKQLADLQDRAATANETAPEAMAAE